MSTPPPFRIPREDILANRIDISTLYEWHAKENPERPIFLFHDGNTVNTITYKQIVPAVRRAARYVKARMPPAPGTVAVVALADSITYTTTCLGIVRAGYTKFVISQRNVPAALVDMFRKTDCRHVLASSDSTIQTIMAAVLKEMDDVTVIPMPSYRELFPESAPEDDLAQSDDLPKEFDMHSSPIIMHSSGSTNHPKPIYWTHARLMTWATSPWYGTVDFNGAKFAIHGTPLFHGMGVWCYYMAAITGAILTVFPPVTPPIFPTPDNVFEATMKTDSEYVMTAPLFIESWARDQEKVAYMTKMKAVMFGGAPLAQEVGDSLASLGISLCTTFGCTEVGALGMLFVGDPGMDWPYFPFNPIYNTIAVEAATVFTNSSFCGIGLQEDPAMPLPKANTQINGRNAYATNDLVELHPTKPGLYKYYGRLDDQIVLSNGEKTNPIPLEKLQEFRNKIWETIERANGQAPQHSRIFKEMVMVTLSSKPFTYNIKGYPRRPVILKLYSDEIEALYKQVEESAQMDIAAPTVWNADGARTFIRTTVEKVTNRSLKDDADLFRNGCDSLQATWIRNTILRVVRELSPTAAQQVPINLIYQAPTIVALAEAVLAIVNRTSTVSPFATAAADLERLAEERRGDHGTTGGFGCDALEHLLLDESIAKVYAFGRQVDRQQQRFVERGLDVTLLGTPRFKAVEAVLEAPDFGIDPALLEEIRGSVTHVMHNAWTVNFNMSLASFQPDLKAVRTWSISASALPSRILQAAADCTIPPPIPEIPIEPSAPLGTGYGESKWVAEQILRNATTRAGLPALVVRLGQISGAKTGHWNEREWFPALVKSAEFTKCLPDLDGDVSFILGHPASRAFVEMRRSPAPFLHLVHPRPVPWRTLVVPIASALAAPLVPYADWLAALELSGADADAASANPALRLLDFFRSRAAVREGREPLGTAILDTGRACEASPTLKDMSPLTTEDAERWVAAWRASGFLKA
ncbi:acetyl-CoA synthetase-like protein [Epithele typhae]|uniref:acetyl-CoA synthetase-like protein n=1 Tax=Epithele typhae TaxID=378194 RepID=UPI002008DC8D|nr:acetyl-CoA synthetase-like protein [Epithele typhae]KAH9943386.1 acetyl-CoA synthetase-like protein [Epithele typhae]